MPQGPKQLIQRVELSCYESPIFCPFCGQRIWANDLDEATETERCPHLLFLAHDEGFHYRSAQFDIIMGAAHVPEIDAGERGFDEYTDKVPLREAVKLAVYMPASVGSAGIYYGFAPRDDV